MRVDGEGVGGGVSVMWMDSGQKAEPQMIITCGSKFTRFPSFSHNQLLRSSKYHCMNRKMQTITATSNIYAGP